MVLKFDKEARMKPHPPEFDPRFPRGCARASGFFLLVTAMAGMVSCAAALGQEPLPVFVEFDFGDVELLKKNPKAEQTALKVAEAVVECLKKADHREYFPWKIEAKPGAGLPKIRLKLVVDSNITKWELRIEAFKEKGGLLDELSLQRIVSEPGDLELRRGNGERRMPLMGEFPGLVSKWLESRFLRPGSQREFQSLMKAVAPLGDCRVLVRAGVPKALADVEGVLQLDWYKFRHLSQSSFTVFCQEKNQALVNLDSVGESKPAEYLLAGQKTLGIAVIHKKWNGQDINLGWLPKFVQLSTGRVYLEEYVGLRGLPPAGGLQATDQ
jgi:hypothetical protein